MCHANTNHKWGKEEIKICHTNANHKKARATMLISMHMSKQIRLLGQKGAL